MPTDLPHRVLVIGAGSIGERHARCLLATGRANVALADTNRDLMTEVAGRYGITSTFASLKEAVDAGITAAVIATPATLHVPMAQQLVDAGVHVMIEKPLAVGLEGVDALRESVERTGVTCCLAYVYRTHPALSAMRAAIVEGRFGRPLQLVATCGQHFPTFRPAYRQTYYVNHASGGGAVQDALTHVINASEWLIGPIDRVTADVDHLALKGTSVEDTAHVLARHGRVLANYSLNQHQSPNEVTITAICERGTARFEMHNNRWMSMAQPCGEWQIHDADPIERDTLFRRQAEAFMDAIEGRSKPLCTLDEGARTLRANIAILKSAREGTWMQID